MRPCGRAQSLRLAAKQEMALRPGVRVRRASPCVGQCPVGRIGTQLCNREVIANVADNFEVVALLRTPERCPILSDRFLVPFQLVRKTAGSCLALQGQVGNRGSGVGCRSRAPDERRQENYPSHGLTS